MRVTSIPAATSHAVFAATHSLLPCGVEVRTPWGGRTLITTDKEYSKVRSTAHANTEGRPLTLWKVDPERGGPMMSQRCAGRAAPNNWKRSSLNSSGTWWPPSNVQDSAANIQCVDKSRSAPTGCKAPHCSKSCRSASFVALQLLGVPCHSRALVNNAEAEPSQQGRQDTGNTPCPQTQRLTTA